VERDERKCEVKFLYRGRSARLWVPENDVTKLWTYSICETDEHLAMLLGHELSHVLHGHSSDAANLKLILLVLQLVALSVLDVTGLLSMLTVLGLAPALKYSIELPFSRDQEFEADATGLRIAARAGYNPHDASSFFDRLKSFSAAYGSSGGRNWNSTHPTDNDRISRLLELEVDAMEYYKRSQVRPDSGRLGANLTKMELLFGIVAGVAVGVITLARI